VQNRGAGLKRRRTATNALALVNNHTSQSQFADAAIVNFFKGNLQRVRHTFALLLAGIAPTAAATEHLLEDAATTAATAALYRFFTALIVELALPIVAEDFKRLSEDFELLRVATLVWVVLHSELAVRLLDFGSRSAA